ncbi:MAG: hypothetical protein VYC34_10500, partial [Planctomycetota bacterium]|nr:hypothetical protein [Planctomycetota bacterium]
MDRLRQALQTIQTQLARLGASQKLLIASLVVVMLMTFFIVSQYAGGQKWVELWPGSSADEQTALVRLLGARNVQHRVDGSRLLVPADQQHSVLALMGENQMMPSDSQLLFSNLVENQSWTMNSAQHKQLSRIALQNELSRVISKFGGVRSASVFIDEPERSGGLGQAARAPSASVTVFTASGGTLKQPMVDAIANMVASAKSGLDIANVRVIDGTTAI